MSAHDGLSSARAGEAAAGPSGLVTLLLVVAGIVGASAAASCCVVPFVLFTFGISGAWITNLTALGRFQPVAVVLTLAAVAAGFVAVYRPPRVACQTGYCAQATASRLVKAGLWLATALIVMVLAWPLLVRLFIA